MAKQKVVGEKDPRTYTKLCSVCKETKLADGNFFKVKAMKDGYASRCKGCWNKRVEVESPPQGPKPEKRTINGGSSHSVEEINKIEKDTGLKLEGFIRAGGKFLDRQPRERGGFTEQAADVGATIDVPVFVRK